MNTSIPTWSEALETGIKAIDNDHKALFEEIQEVCVALIKDESTAHIEQAINCLENYTNEHFQREETFMLNAGYPKTEEHIRTHRNLSRQVQCLRELNASETHDIDPVKLSRFLGEWLSHHILKVDMDYVPYLQGKNNDRDEGIAEQLHEVNVPVPMNKQDVVERFLRVITSDHPLAHELSELMESFEKRLAEHELQDAQALFCRD